MKKDIYKLIIAVLLVAFGFYSQDHPIQSPKEQVSSASAIRYDKSIRTEQGKPIKVVRVIDGDTVELINGERLRYIGIDTPEEFDERKPVQCFAVEAAERNRQLVEGQMITFYKDVSTYDKYGRWLGFVYLADGTFVNKKMVEEGYAFAYDYPPDVSKSTELRQAETYARTNKLGLWAGCEVSTLSTGRQQTNPVK